MGTSLFPSLHRVLLIGASVVVSFAVTAPQVGADTVGYVQTNLVSSNLADASALLTDPNSINPWGITSSATSPFWVSDQGSGLSTLYAVTSVGALQASQF